MASEVLFLKGGVDIWERHTRNGKMSLENTWEEIISAKEEQLQESYIGNELGLFENLQGGHVD